MSQSAFIAGNRILYRRHPFEAWTVEAIEHRRVRCTKRTLPGLSPIVMIAPVEDFIAAPEGWEDAPAMPTGFVRNGLSYEADCAAREAEDADIEHQRAMLAWHLSMRTWALLWLMRIDPTQAHIERAGHLAQAERCAQRIKRLLAPVTVE